MANLFKIEKEYKQFILGLSSDEVTEYYKQLNKKIIECYPSLNSNWNNEELDSLLASVEDVTNILSSTYKLDSLNRINIASRYLELSDKYLEEIDLATYKILAYQIIGSVTSIQLLFKSIYNDFNHMYLYYDYATSIGTSILEEELNVPEELLEPLEPYFYNKNNSSFYGAKAISFLNDNIKVNLHFLEKYVESFKKFKRMEFNPEELPEDLVEVLNLYNKSYDLGIKTIEEFEEIKKQPFKMAVEICVKVKKEMDSKINDSNIKYGLEPINIDYEALYKSELASAPKYDFENFELILPTTEGAVN